MSALAKAKPDTDDFKDSPLRKAAILGIELWYAQRVYHHRANFQQKKERPEPNVPDEYLRPETFIGPSLKADGVTAHGVETKPPGFSQFPGGSYIRLDPMSGRDLEDELARQRELSELRGLVHTAMFDLIGIRPKYHMAVEMWAAGWSFGSISSALSVSKPTAHQFYECGLTHVISRIYTRRKAVAQQKMSRQRRMREGDLWAGI